MLEKLTGRRILVVDDEVLIAMLLEDSCIDAGCEVIGPFGRLDQAMAAMATGTADAAILDVNLAGEKIYPLAELLERRGIPFLLLSGYGELAAPDRPHWPVCTKPFSIEDILRRLASLLADPA